jgi:excisionase family DNA binding protein
MEAQGTARRPVELLDVPSVARMLALPVRSVWVLAERGELPHYKLGRRLRFAPRDLEEVVERLRVEVGR